MVPTLEELADRLAALEREVGRLATRRDAPRAKDWRRVVGRFKDDPVMREILELGRELRDAEGPDDEFTFKWV